MHFEFGKDADPLRVLEKTKHVFQYIPPKMLRTIAALWYVAYEYVCSFFAPKPVIRPVTPPFFRTTKKVRYFTVKKPPLHPLSQPRAQNTVERSTRAYQYNRYED